ncbi:MAG: homocysteine S-methyltransferase family protein [Planctomycetes bacterium]|nr:homocysteine S-methyltransferase family protein [Planctomycetota bacterium]
MHSLMERLLAQGTVVTDGAWGTQLQARGLADGECPDAWNLSHPDQVEAVARDYVEAGSQVILTNTFRANRLTLAGYGLAEQVRAINRRGAEISKRAAAGRARVFASIGPSGKMLFTGEVTEEDWLAAFAEQAEALAEGGADGFVVETLSDPAEARIAVQAARRTGLPVVGSLVFDSGKEKDRTMMGTTPEQAAAELAEAGADAVGANCGLGIAGYVPICRRLRRAVDLPVWIKANAGLPALVNGRTVYATRPEEFAGYVPALIDAGASFIGSCCGTGPEFIRAIRKELSR